MDKKYLELLKESTLKISDKNYEIKKSGIHGNGSFSLKLFNPGEFIEIAIISTNENTGILEYDFKTTEFGTHLNHSWNPNARTDFENQRIFKTYAIERINPGDEITVNYTNRPELEQPEESWR